MRHIIIAFTLFLICAQASSDNLAYEAEYQAEYKGGWIPIKVSASRKLEKLESGQWRSVFAVYSSIMDLSETSLMSLGDKGFVPNTYEFKTTGFATKERRKQVFNWDERKVWGDHKQTHWKYLLIDGTQDSMSYQEQLRLDLINNKAELSYPVVYKHKLKTYEFERVGFKEIKIPNGLVKALEIQQKINKYNKLESRSWFAIDYDFVLLKLKQKRPDGTEQVISLKRAKVNGKELVAFSK